MVVVVEVGVAGCALILIVGRARFPFSETCRPQFLSKSLGTDNDSTELTGRSMAAAAAAEEEVVVVVVA